MPYSAVTHPCPVSRRNGGTRSSTLAVHTTLVSPTSIRTDPSAWRRKSRVILTGRIWLGCLPSGRMVSPLDVRRWRCASPHPRSQFLLGRFGDDRAGFFLWEIRLQRPAQVDRPDLSGPAAPLHQELDPLHLAVVGRQADDDRRDGKRGAALISRQHRLDAIVEIEIQDSELVEEDVADLRSGRARGRGALAARPGQLVEDRTH